MSTLSAAPSPLFVELDDNALLPLLFGEHDRNLARLEHSLDVSIHVRGNRLSIVGSPEAALATRSALLHLYHRLAERKRSDGIPEPLVAAEIDAVLQHAREDSDGGPGGGLVTWRRRIVPRTPGQRRYLDALEHNELVFGTGPAGTGKTYLAVAVGVALMRARRIERLVLSRPAVEAGERLGFLPGDMREKIDPYLRPLYDALNDMMPADQVERRLSSGAIEIAPLAFMRGRTLTSAYIILDEAQNATATQMQMFLTRLGENSRMVVTGDPSQVDLPAGQRSGLADALEILDGVEGIGRIRLGSADVVRHPLVTRIVRAYARRRGDSVEPAP